MDQLTKIATLCANKVLHKTASPAIAKSLDEITQVFSESARHNKALKEFMGHVNPKQESVSMAMKALLGLGAGKVILDSSGNKPSTGWRR